MGPAVDTPGRRPYWRLGQDRCSRIHRRRRQRRCSDAWLSSQGVCLATHDTVATDQQALALYNNLSGRAWRDAEELDLARLDADDGVEVFTTWVSEKYLDREVVKVGRCMSEFFKMLRKNYNQDIREFNQEYDRQLSRLKEVGCNLPDVCQAWWYLDKLRLDNSAELNLLSSTGNQYSLAKLQEAAIIQDRMNRRLWEAKRGDKDRRGHQQQALVAEHDELYETEPEDASEAEDEIMSEGDPEAHEALVAFQNAKSKYQAFVRARGTVSSGGNGLIGGAYQAGKSSFLLLCLQATWPLAP